MGHTVWSNRIVVDIMLNELKSFGKALRKEDREIFERLLKKPLKHFGSITYASSIHAWAFILICVMLEQEKRIRDIEDKHESMADGCIQEEELDSIMAEDT
ncbi:hypothetical protein JW968_02405 [Candidatus Woesearchaeota archaeon]|nr:hypothetical protein [Candidatus Woesearchaeota archaeon]